MPSSLVFAALALAWIVVLVPMVARRRQEVRRTADSALAARVLRRGDAATARGRPPGPSWPSSSLSSSSEEVPDMPDDPYDPYPEEPRRYRPGRGGFDPHAAALAARAKYAFRQRVVLFLLLTALATGLLAGLVLPVLWWAHGGTDLILFSYLAYLRRQVRIEQEIRQRRLERAARTRRAIEARRPAPPDRTSPGQPAADRSLGRSVDQRDRAERAKRTAGAEQAEPTQRLPQRPAPPPGTAVVDLDDEDPALYDLDVDALAPYRRAAGE
jgi:hypothetical protein